MSSDLRIRIDRAMRSIAYRILTRRDGVPGWEADQKAFLASLSKTEGAIRSELESKLRNILIHASESSPYYRKLWRQSGLDPVKDDFPESLQRYPFLTKDIIRAHAAEMISDKYHPTTLDADLTSGTTRARTTFYRNHACTVSRVGRQWGALQFCGYSPGMRRGLVWGVNSDLPQPGDKKSIRQLFREYATSQEVLGCKVMNNADMLEFHRRLVEFRPDVLYGYPSAMAQFGAFIQEQGLQPVEVATLFTTAERLTPKQRNFLKDAFSGDVFNLYCTREYGCIGFECSRHNGLHIDTGSVYIEITRDGKRVSDGETGEITITDLLNYGMPIIRSRTGDIGSLSDKPCECGLPLPLLKSLDGRVFDNIYRPDGSVIAGVLLSYLLLDIPAIRATQYVQENIHELSVILEVTDDFTDVMEAEAMRQLKERMGNDLQITTHRVKEIPRNPLSGKYQEVVSKIPEHERILRVAE